MANMAVPYVQTKFLFYFIQRNHGPFSPKLLSFNRQLDKVASDLDVIDYTVMLCVNIANGRRDGCVDIDRERFVWVCVMEA